MTQRLGLARVLLHDPQVLLLDEPASGLDPRARIEMRNLLKRLQAKGKTIMVSSHILPELGDICNKVGIIERGELIVNTTVAEVMRRVRERTVMKIAVAENTAGAKQTLAALPQVERVEEANGQFTVTLRDGEKDPSPLAAALVAGGYKLTLLKEDEVNLETAFMLLTEGITA